MAKINITELEGYREGMTAEEKLALFENYELPEPPQPQEPDLSGYIKKSQFDKVASEAAQYKKQLREAMSADEAAKEKEAEERKAMQQQIADLKLERDIDRTTAKYLALGYNAEMAAETAKALLAGDMELVFKNQAAHMETREKALEKSLKAEVLKTVPVPPAGSAAEPTVSQEEFAKMNYAQRNALYRENPELYKELRSK